MSKFAVRAFADAIRTEWAPHGVGVTLISPGFIQSEIRRVDNTGRFRSEFRDPVPAWLVYPVAAAAREIVDAMEQKRVEAIISFHGKLMVWLSRFFPGVVRRWIAPRFATPPGKRGWSHESSSD
jgi:short-subunit dehydrogenase